MKRSLTGLMTSQHEVNRLDNLFFKKIRSAYYLLDYGLDWDFFTNQKIEIPLNSFLSYMTQRSANQAIIVTNLDADVKNFSIYLTAKLLAEDVLLIRGF